MQIGWGEAWGRLICRFIFCVATPKRSYEQWPLGTRLHPLVRLTSPACKEGLHCYSERPWFDFRANSYSTLPVCFPQFLLTYSHVSWRFGHGRFLPTSAFITHDVTNFALAASLHKQPTRRMEWRYLAVTHSGEPEETLVLLGAETCPTWGGRKAELSL
jgi:hypothetical protein